MKITIIADDGFVSIGGRAFNGVSMAALPAGVHAVQWDGSSGTVEYAPQKVPASSEMREIAAAYEIVDADPDNPDQLKTTLVPAVMGQVDIPAHVIKRQNETITDLAQFQGVLDLAEAMRQAQDAPKSITLAELKAIKLQEVNGRAQAIASSLTADYPDFEKDTWPDQQAEVLAWNAGGKNNSTLTPCLDAMAGYRGILPQAYKQKTLEKVQAYRAAGWYLAGTRQKFEDQVKAAQTAADLDAITIVFDVPA